MKKNLCFILAALLAWGGLTARAGAQGDGWYVAPKLGVSILSGESYFDGSHAPVNDYGTTGEHLVYTGSGTPYTHPTAPTPDRIHGGPVNYSKSLNKPGFAGALAIGYDFSDYGAPLRTELEFTTRAPFQTEENGTGPLGDFTFKQKTTIQTLMFNTYLDFENDTTFTPYIGAGLGMAWIKGNSTYTLKNRNFSNYYYYAYEDQDPDDDYYTAYMFGTNLNAGNSREASSSETKLVFSLNAGGAWELTEGLSLDLGYRYFHFGKLKTGDYSRDRHLREVPGGAGDNPGYTEIIGNDPQGISGYKRAGLHEVMLGLRFAY